MECTICHKEYCIHARRDMHGGEDGEWHWRCIDCGELGEGANPPMYGIAMYEGKVVNPAITPEWGGFDVCKECYDKYTI